MNEEQYLTYWKLIENKEKVVIVPQTGSRSSPIHNHRGIYFYNTNCYEILKEHLQLLHKINPRGFQVTLE